jgi:hypothetical protein
MQRKRLIIFFVLSIVIYQISIGSAVQTATYIQNFDAPSADVSADGISSGCSISGSSAFISLTSGEIFDAIRVYPHFNLTTSYSANLSFWWYYDLNVTANYTIATMISLKNPSLNDVFSICYLLKYNGNPYPVSADFTYANITNDAAAQTWNELNIINLRDIVNTTVHAMQDQFNSQSCSINPNELLSVDQIVFYMISSDGHGTLYIDELGLASFSIVDPCETTTINHPSISSETIYAIITVFTLLGMCMIGLIRKRR